MMISREVRTERTAFLIVRYSVLKRKAIVRSKSGDCALSTTFCLAQHDRMEAFAAITRT
jgi:hypothetical protein